VIAAELASLREARARMIRVGLAERRRLEQTRHDETQQRLLAATAAIGLARVETDDGRRHEVLASADAELRVALDELRALARELHPLVLTRDGLAAAVQDMAARSPVAVEADVDVGRLPEVLEWAAYWLVCEALARAVGGAGARRACVVLTSLDDRVSLRWTDDGPQRTDAGLQEMTDLVRSLGGTIDIGSGPAGGTLIVADLARYS
jgi:signal transduction histidine kinase